MIFLITVICTSTWRSSITPAFDLAFFSKTFYATIIYQIEISALKTKILVFDCLDLSKINYIPKLNDLQLQYFTWDFLFHSRICGDSSFTELYIVKTAIYEKQNHTKTNALNCTYKCSKIINGALLNYICLVQVKKSSSWNCHATEQIKCPKILQWELVM